MIYRARGLRKIYKHGKNEVTAVDDVSLEIAAGERLGIVGESGSGKSTLIRMLAGLSKPASGEIFLDDERITGKKERELAPMRARVQVVFQDPRSSLDPRMKIRKIVTEALRSPWVKGRLGITDDPDARCAQVLEQVELDPADADKYPHEFSGGQRQRIAIARALASHPDVLIADEAVSALDVSVRAQVLNLLNRIADQENLTLLFVSHDLAVVRYLCDRVIVMRNGKVVESGDTSKVLYEPEAEYTKNLLSAIPRLRVD